VCECMQVVCVYICVWVGVLCVLCVCCVCVVCYCVCCEDVNHIFLGENVTTIPGKPHEKGIELFVLASFSDKDERKPYILGFEPRWGVPYPKPLDYWKRLMQSFADFYGFNPHAIVDARFMDAAFIDWVELHCQRDGGGGVTAALPSNHMPSLFSLLSLDVGDDEWRCAVTDSGRMCSFKRVRDKAGDLVEWRLATWGWKEKDTEIGAMRNPFTLKDFKLLTKLSHPALIQLAMNKGELGEG
jgi:hypothetical protein